MGLEEKTTIIQSIPLFKSLPQEQIQAISNAVHNQVFSPKTVFITQDETSDSAYIIYKGSVRVYRLTEEGEEINLAILGSGDIVGEMALLDNDIRSANVEALQETHVLILQRSDFQHILLTHPQAAIIMLKTFALRVRKTNEYVEDVLSKNLETRTWKILQSLAQYFPNRDINLSQEELATIIGATRARVTETLNKLEEQKKIVLSHRLIHIL